jgi:crotonobetainyl-CoA:carnitine CoA-transferase CaiB-like acyl-CoA transferase
MENLPLSDIRVLDLSRNVAGQFTTKSLSWLGADVILVEPPGGTATRRMGPFTQSQVQGECSSLFLYLNTNKQSVTLDFCTRTGSGILRELVAHSNVVVLDYSAKETITLGLEYARLAEYNPCVIVLSITDFGQTGPYRDWKATDLTLLALGGMSHMIGDKDKQPLTLAGHQAHYNGSAHGFAAILVALRHLEVAGQGTYIDVSLLDAMAFTEWKGYTFYAADGKIPSRGSETTATSYILRCHDGYVGFIVDRAGYLEPLVHLTSIERLREPKYREPGGLNRHADEIHDMLAGWTKDRSKEEIYHSAQRLGLPFCYFPSLSELTGSDQYASRNFFVEVDHPVAGKGLYPGAPMKYGQMTFPNGRAPLLGEHNEKVYAELGYGNDDLAILRERGII